MIAVMVPFPPDTLADAVAMLALPLLLAAPWRRLVPPHSQSGLRWSRWWACCARARPAAARSASPAVGRRGVARRHAAVAARGALGGGDVKLLAATALLLPPALIPVQLLAIALAGGALALLHLALRPLLRNLRADGRPRGTLRRALRREGRRIRAGARCPMASHRRHRLRHDPAGGLTRWACASSSSSSCWSVSPAWGCLASSPSRPPRRRRGRDRRGTARACQHARRRPRRAGRYAA